MNITSNLHTKFIPIYNSYNMLDEFNNILRPDWNTKLIIPFPDWNYQYLNQTQTILRNKCNIIYNKKLDIPLINRTNIPVGEIVPDWALPFIEKHNIPMAIVVQDNYMINNKSSNLNLSYNKIISKPIKTSSSIKQTDPISIKQTESISSIKQTKPISIKQTESISRVKQTESISRVKQTESISRVKQTESISRVKQTEPIRVEYDEAGVIVINNEYQSKNGSIQTILLGLNSTTLKYELFYGTRDTSDRSIIDTASRYCTELTANIFRFRSKIFNNKYCVKSKNNKKIIYIIRVQHPKYNVNRIFYNNLSKINDHVNNWIKITDITHIGINEAISSGILTHTQGDFKMFDVNDTSINISECDAKFISDAIKNKMNICTPIQRLKFIPNFKDNDDKFPLTDCYFA
jgi:hypothetical protein